jgi:site-specific DNA-methyltransferase (adenine-specific)
MPREALPRLDTNFGLREELLRFSRLSPGEVWVDPVRGHRVIVGDATDPSAVTHLTGGHRYELSVHDPPYNVRLPGPARQDGAARENPAALGNPGAAPGTAPSDSGADAGGLDLRGADAYLEFSRAWIANAVEALAADAHFYLWAGADQRAGFHPLPELMLLLREHGGLTSRSMITLRNQRGYGTAKNWMSVRQELLYYTRGAPRFEVQYTEIPRLLRGYYKSVAGEQTENSERARSPYIRPGNVWVDLQQVFYRREENVPGAYAQKPLDALRRIIRSAVGATPVLDFFAHAGTTLLACELEGRVCHTCDIDPVFAEITIRRLERYRETGRTGWQWRTPFPELGPYNGIS